MLLIPFVENAFKHGNLINGFLHIKIKLNLIGDELHFEIQNTFLKDNTQTIKEGLGLINIKKRLDLLYKNNHKLNIEQSNQFYKVNLIINQLNTSQNA